MKPQPALLLLALAGAFLFVGGSIDPHPIDLTDELEQGVRSAEAGTQTAASRDGWSLWWALPALLAFTAAGKILLLGLAYAGPGLGRLLRFAVLLPLLGFWSRIAPEHLLENPIRRRVREYIHDHPGATIMEVRNALDIAWGTAVYHLDRLARSGELVDDRRINHHRYFLANTPEARVRGGWATLQQPSAYNLARAIANNPGIHQKGLCEDLGIQNPAASKHLARLREAGLVEARRISRYVVYDPTQRLQTTLELMDAQEATAALA